MAHPLDPLVEGYRVLAWDIECVSQDENYRTPLLAHWVVDVVDRVRNVDLEGVDKGADDVVDGRLGEQAVKVGQRLQRPW